MSGAPTFLAVLSLSCAFHVLAGDGPDFNRDVRPILSAKCFKCHGPDDKTREAGLRFDVRADALKPAKSGRPALVPGHADQSELVRRIFSTDPKTVMPPPAAKSELTAAQKDTLKRWIAAGAAYQPHWAFVRPQQAALPAVQHAAWSRHPIDAFVLARLEKEGLLPSPPADPYVLCRRLHLDLIGLPPTPEEADLFVAAAQTNRQAAVEALVDRLLASPWYGERWARRWLDLAMYADTNGYEKDRPRSIWPYRDWVIRALNDGIPFDRFSILQIAGDLLPTNERPAGMTALEAKTATGFFRNTMLNEEGGIDPLEYRYHAMAARMHMTGSAWLGLTLQCAQCHTHKFDPITHREYFQLMAFLNNADEPDLDLPAEEDRAEGRAERAAKLLAALPDRWPAAAAAAKPVKPASVTAASGQKPALLDDGSALFAEPSPETDSYTITFDTEERHVSRLKLEALTDASLPAKGPGRVAHGNFVLTEIVVTAAPKNEPAKAVPVQIAQATAEAEQDNFPVAQAIDGQAATGWAVHRPGKPLNTPKSAVFQFVKPVDYPAGTRFVVRLDQLYGKQHTLGRVRLAVESSDAKPAESPRAIAERKFAEWLTTERARGITWKTVRPVAAQANTPLLTMQPDGSILASGDTTKMDTYTLAFGGELRGARALRLEALPDDTLPGHGPGLCYYEGPKGDFFMGELLVIADGVTQRIARATETYAKNNFGNSAVSAMAATDGDLQTGWSCAGRAGQRSEAVFNFAAPLGAAKNVSVRMVFGRHYACSLGRFRLSVTDNDQAVARPIDNETAALLALPDAQLSGEQRSALRNAFLLQAPELADARKEIENLRKPAVRATTLVLQERPPENPRPTHLHHRGEFLQPGERVEAGALAVLHPFPSNAPRNRLEFARWLFAPENPLTARVVVNREWDAFFGAGLVRTVADFGYQGELPSHPELLDWLAVALQQQGWSIKQLHRLIATSATYAQASAVPPNLLARDPENRWLARGPRVRLEAELVRDAVLRASGQLSDKIGGPSVYPPQPSGVSTEGTYGALAWNESQGEDRYRRALYTFAKRTAPYAMFNTFDGPSGEACVARREVSNSALQSLTALNDRVFMEAAQALGSEFAKQTTSLEERVRLLFRRCLTRAPDAEELSLLVTFHETQRARFAAAEADAKALAGDGPNAVERAAWTATARAVLNLDEFVTKG